MKIIKNIVFAIRKITEVSKLVLLLLGISIIFTVCTTLADLFAIKVVIDFILSESFTVRTVLAYLFLYLVLMGIIKLYDRVILTAYINKFEMKLKSHTMTEIYRKIPRIGIIHYNDTAFYDKLSRAMAQSDARYFYLLVQIFSFLINLITFIFVFGIYNDAVILFAVGINVASYITYYFIENKRKYAFDKKEEPFSRLDDYMNRVFSRKEYAPELRVSEGIRERLLEKYSEQAGQYSVSYSSYLKTATRRSVLMVTASYLIYWLSSLYISGLLLGEKISVGDFLVLLNVVSCMTNEMVNVLKVLPDIYQSSLYIDDIKEILDYPDSLAKDGAGEEAASFESLVFRDVVFRYQKDTSPVLRNLSFSVHKNEIIAIVGLNGAGKSTMIDCMLGLLKPESGSVELNGKDYRSYTSESIKNIFSIVFQDYQVYEISIAENILMRQIQSDSDISLAEEALKYTGLYEKVAGLPDGIDTVVSPDCRDADFSYGEKQKIAIARAYARKSPVLIFDEPSSALDIYAANAFYSRLLRLRECQGKTIIFSAHRLCYAAHADRVFYMEDGRVTGIGSHEELMQRNEGYAALYNLQTKELFQQNG